jgi:hypothetical protein
MTNASMGLPIRQENLPRARKLSVWTPRAHAPERMRSQNRAAEPQDPLHHLIGARRFPRSAYQDAPERFSSDQSSALVRRYASYRRRLL